MTKVILGIDGGGTKTHAALVDLNGNILATAGNGAANWERIGVAAVEKSLNEIIDVVCASAQISRDEIVDSTFALAGIDWQEDEELLAPVVNSLGLTGKCQLINDSFAALFAGIPEGIGCVSIAGTGGKSAGRSATQSIQTMGMELVDGEIEMADESGTDSHYGKIETPETLGQAIRRKRKEIGLKQEIAAGMSGVGTKFLSQLENGKETAELGKTLQVLRGYLCLS